MNSKIKLILVLMLSFLLSGCHSHKYEETIIEAICEQDGYTICQCNCGDIYYKEIIKATGHKLKVYESKEPTCTEKGYTSKIECSICNKVIQESVVIETKEHNYQTVKVQVIDNKPVQVALYCDCGACKVIDDVIEDKHVFGEWEIINSPTFTKTGIRQKICIECGYVIKEEIPMLVHTHNYEISIINPTCLLAGYTEYKCSCGVEYKDNYVSAINHKYSEWKVINEPTDENTGLKQKICLNCNDIIEEPIAKLDHIHQYQLITVPSTCLNMGYVKNKCSCGYEYIEKYINPTGHKYTDWKIIEEATEEKVGLKQEKCINCNYIITEKIPMKDHIHRYDEKVYQATCTEQGYTLYTCKCGESYKDNYIAPIGHNYANEEVIIKENCNQEGKIKKECLNCKNIIYEIIPENDEHQEILVSILKEATCTVDGIGKYCCAVCGKSIKYLIIPAGHNIELSQTLVEPTCTEDGIAQYWCSICHEEISYKIIPAQHKYGIIETIKEATCTTSGITKYGCINCGADVKYIKVEPVHNYGDIIIITPPTTSQEGKGKQICSKCNEEKEVIIPILKEEDN